MEENENRGGGGGGASPEGESGMPVPLHYALVASSSRPAPKSFAFIHSRTVKFGGCSPPQMKWAVCQRARAFIIRPHHQAP